MRRQGAFTLIEIMIVVAIIALLAAMAVPSFLRARQKSQNAKFMNGLRIACDAFQQYAIENRAYPPDVFRGIVPPGMATYFDTSLNWTGRTPIGGNWDWDYNVFGFVAGVSVASPTASIEQITEIDARMDDGDLSTGQFQDKGGGRYSYIIE